MYKKGQSGNPAGRAKGSNKVQALRNGLMEHLPDIINALVVQAKMGDIQAAKLILERVMPALKSQSESVTFQIASNDSLVDSGQVIIDKVSRAEISTDTGAQLMNILALQARFVENTELIGRIEALERARRL